MAFLIIQDEWMQFIWPKDVVVNVINKWRHNPLERCINLWKTKYRPLYLKTQSVPRSKHFHLGYKISQFMV